MMQDDLLDFDQETVNGLLRPKSIDSYKTLVLNGDYQPIRYFPLSVWPWQKAMKLLYEDVINPVAFHEDVVVRSAHQEHQVPSVVALRTYVPPPIHVPFTKYNVFLRDLFRCQYCGERFTANQLTFDHVFPRSKGGKTSWANITSACHDCNERKDSRLPKECGMYPRVQPYEPSVFEMREKGRKFPPRHLHKSWEDYLYWDSELES